MNIFKFKKSKQSEVKPMGFVTTVERPKQPVNKLSDEELDNLRIQMVERKKNESSIDPYFLQEISDRLYGPESIQYIEAIKELNEKFKPRKGRTGHDIYKSEI